MSPKTKAHTAVSRISKITGRAVSKEAALVVLHGVELGRRYPLEKAETVIGRSSHCDVQIDQESVSRRHASLTLDGESVVLRDLKSTNGTLVNDQRVDEYVLRNGDFVKVGRSILKFIAGGNLEQLYHEEVYRLTTRDGLTQLFNKRYFHEQLERELARCERYGRPLSLYVVDLDHFKAVNDSYGHLAGDQILADFATLVAKNLRREDVFARFGGDEFALALPEIALPQARLLGEKIQRLLCGHGFTVADHPVDLTVSLGLAGFPEAGRDPKALLKLADDQLYEAKRLGRDRQCG